MHLALRVLALSLALPCAGQEPQPGTTYSLAGKVTDFVTGKGIAYSTIEVKLPVLLSKHYSTITAADGSYVLTGLPRAGKAHLLCHQLGYRPDPKEEDILLEKRDTRWNVRLFAASPDTAYLDQAAAILYRDPEIGTREEARALAQELPTTQLATMAASFQKELTGHAGDGRQQEVAKLLQTGSERDLIEAPHDPGVYALASGSDGLSHIVKIPASSMDRSSASSFTGATTYGITARRMRPVLQGPRAKVELETPRPSFLLYSAAETNLAASDVDPLRLVLVTLHPYGDVRYASSTLFGGRAVSAGDSSPGRQGFVVQKLRPGVYRVTPDTDLPPGQYALRDESTYFEFGIEPKP